MGSGTHEVSTHPDSASEHPAHRGDSLGPCHQDQHPCLAPGGWETPAWKLRKSPPRDPDFSFEVLPHSTMVWPHPGQRPPPRALGVTRHWPVGPTSLCSPRPGFPRPVLLGLRSALSCRSKQPLQEPTSHSSPGGSRQPLVLWPQQPSCGPAGGTGLLEPGGLQADQHLSRLPRLQAMTQDAARGHDVHGGPHPARPGALLARAQPQPPLHLLVR